MKLWKEKRRKKNVKKEEINFMKKILVEKTLKFHDKKNSKKF